MHIPLARLLLATALLGSLGACTIVPAHPGAYRGGGSVYVETYPEHRHGYPDTYYYERNRRDYDRREYRYYRDEPRRYEQPRRIESPLESAARTHRDVRRSLGLPRLPGMP